MKDAIQFAGSTRVAAVLLAGVALWWRAARRLLAGQPLVAPEPGRPPPWGLFDLLVALLLHLLAIFLAARCMKWQFGIDLERGADQLELDQRAWLMLASAVAYLAACLLTLAWLFVRHRIGAAELGLARKRLAHDVVTGGAAFVMLAPVVYGIQWLLVKLIESEHPLLELVKEQPSVRLFAITGFAAVVVAPVAEEFFYRLLLQGWLERTASDGDDPWTVLAGGHPPVPATLAEDPASVSRSASAAWRRRWPIVVSALVFAMMHYSHGPDPVPLFVLALGLGYLYQQTRRIVPCVVVHFCLNAFTLVMLLVGVLSLDRGQGRVDRGLSTADDRPLSTTSPSGRGGSWCRQ
jgi:membrane protease YdiL (CAAX protease family)